MTTCDNCRGEGLVGSGPEPWARVGQLVACTPCSGTGEVGEIEAKPPHVEPPTIPATDSENVPAETPADPELTGDDEPAPAEEAVPDAPEELAGDDETVAPEETVPEPPVEESPKVEEDSSVDSSASSPETVAVDETAPVDNSVQ